jgi:hypothetical protein
MAYDLLKGRIPGKNYAIQGHPPIHSFEYVFSAGGYCKPPSYAPPARRWHPNSKASAPLDVSGLQLYEISNTDWEAAVRYMNNLAENVKYTRQVHGDKILSQSDAEKWATLWSKWLLFSSKIETVKTAMQDESLASRMLTATLPALWPSRLLFATVRGSLALMSPDNKRELDGLLKEAHGLHDRFRLQGMNQVAIPYMGDLVVILRSLPKEVSLTEMSSRLRDGAKVGERLLDENTAWWQWRKRDDTKGLRAAIKHAGELAKEIADIDKTVKADASPEAKAGARATLLRLLARKNGKDETYIHTSPSQALREKFIAGLSQIYSEAAALYGVEEVKREATAGLKDDLKKPPEPAGVPLWAWGLAGAVGYAGFKWWTGTNKKEVVIREDVGYNPRQVDDEHLDTETSEQHGEHDEF